MHGLGASIAVLTAKAVEDKKKAEAEEKSIPLVIIDLDADKPATVAAEAPKTETDKP